MTVSIIQLVEHLFKSQGKITQGGLIMLHGLIYVNEGSIENYMSNIESIICDGITSNDDPACGRIASGLVSDLSNYFEKAMTRYAPSIM